MIIRLAPSTTELSGQHAVELSTSTDMDSCPEVVNQIAFALLAWGFSPASIRAAFSAYLDEHRPGSCRFGGPACFAGTRPDWLDRLSR
jgi:hypothetical protein